MSEMKPFLAAYLFMFVVGLIGLWLQRQERKRKLARRGEAKGGV